MTHQPSSDVANVIFFSYFLAKLFAKIVSIFFFFTKVKIKNFECPKSIRNYEKK